MNNNQCQLISIIIPIYNVEKYLDKCLDSVVNQTYRNLEIILVDDGSPDKCPFICDKWQAQDSRIKVIHQKNYGLSFARNEGLRIATGQFIGFVDSDDWIEPNMYEMLLLAINETNADISICNCFLETETKKEFNTNQTTQINKYKSVNKKIQYTPVEAIKILLKGKSFIYNGVWQKLYRKTTILNNYFPVGKIFEDGPWTIKALGNAKKITYINNILYHYRYRTESLSHNVKLKLQQLYDMLEMIKLQEEYIQNYYPELKKYIVLRLQNYCYKEYLEFCMKFYNLDIDNKIRQYLYNIFCQNYPVIILDCKNIRKTIARIIFWLSPRLLLCIYSFMHKNRCYE